MNKEKFYRRWGKIALVILIYMWLEQVYIIMAKGMFDIPYLLTNGGFWLFVFVQTLTYGFPAIPLAYFIFKK